MGKFLDQVMKPGSPAFVILLNCVLAMLFAVMLTVVYTELESSVHMFVMLFIIVGLTVSINWFIIEANNLKKMQLAGSDGARSTQDASKAARAKTD